MTKDRSLFGLVVQQRRFVYLAIAALSGAGILAATRLPSAIYPELTFSRITVVVNGSSLDARQVLFSITRPIEEAISIVPGVARVQSRSIRGGSETNVTFSPSTDMMFALQQVQRIARARAMPEADVAAILGRFTEGRLFGIIGEPRINVLRLNMALDASKPT